jgi:hypothetical protein
VKGSLSGAAKTFTLGSLAEQQKRKDTKGTKKNNKVNVVAVQRPPPTNRGLPRKKKGHEGGLRALP